MSSSDFDEIKPALPSIRDKFQGMHTLEGRFCAAERAFDRALRDEVDNLNGADQPGYSRARRNALNTLKVAGQALEDKLASSSAAIEAHVMYAMTRSLSASAEWAGYEGEASDDGEAAWWVRKSTPGPNGPFDEPQTPPVLAAANKELDISPRYRLLRPLELPSPPVLASCSSQQYALRYFFRRPSELPSPPPPAPVRSSSSELSSVLSLEHVYTRNTPDVESGSESSSRSVPVDENVAPSSEFDLEEAIRHAKRPRASPLLSGARLASPIDSISSSLDRWKHTRLSHTYDEMASPSELLTPERKRSASRARSYSTS